LQLNQEQKRIINAKPNGHTLLKGVAGSGKTTIAVTRLPFLLHNYCFDVDDRILLVTYNKTLRILPNGRQFLLLCKIILNA
jgi:DNA helicase-2/ATP-dependent DNA helicase PcrA